MLQSVITLERLYHCNRNGRKANCHLRPQGATWGFSTKKIFQSYCSRKDRHMQPDIHSKDEVLVPAASRMP